jgi:peptidoglycan hydrolase CwlO-like protein
MKKFIVFIVLLSLLIVSEYYFLTEVFTQKRTWVLAVTLLVTLVCLYSLFRYFKRSLFSS